MFMKLKYKKIFERLRAIYFVSSEIFESPFTQVMGIYIYIYMLAIRITLVIISNASVKLHVKSNFG